MEEDSSVKKHLSVSDSIAVVSVVLAVLLWIFSPTAITKAVGIAIVAGGWIYLAYRSHWVKSLRSPVKHAVAIIGACFVLVGGGRQIWNELRDRPKATFAITWENPSPITYGTALSKQQLNATSEVKGKFVYNPTFGTTLPVGTNTLSVTFLPEEAEKYSDQQMTVPLVVRAREGQKPPPLPTSPKQKPLESSRSNPTGLVSPIITDSQMQAMIGTLLPLAGETVRIMCVGNQQQSQINCQKIQDIFSSAHWIVGGGDVGSQISVTSGTNSTSPVNISVIAPLSDQDPAKTVRLAFGNGRIPISFQKQGWTGPSGLGFPPKITIVVGPSVE